MHDDWDGVDWAEHFSGPSEQSRDMDRRNDSVFDFEEERAPHSKFFFGHIVSFSGRSFSATVLNYLSALDLAQHLAIEYRREVRIEYRNSTWELESVEDWEESIDPLSDQSRKQESALNTVLLISALESGDKQHASDLMRKGFDVDTKVSNRSNLLTLAASRGWSDLCTELIGFDIRPVYEVVSEEQGFYWSADAYFKILLKSATSSGDADTLALMDKYIVHKKWHDMHARWLTGIDVNDDRINPILRDAARLGLTGICSEIVMGGFPCDDIGAANYDSTLGLAIRHRNWETAILLSLNGAPLSSDMDLESIPNDMFRLIEAAAKYGSKKIQKINQT